MPPSTKTVPAVMSGPTEGVAVSRGQVTETSDGAADLPSETTTIETSWGRRTVNCPASSHSWYQRSLPRGSGTEVSLPDFLPTSSDLSASYRSVVWAASPTQASTSLVLP